MKLHNINCYDMKFNNLESFFLEEQTYNEFSLFDRLPFCNVIRLYGNYEIIINRIPYCYIHEINSKFNDDWKFEIASNSHPTLIIKL